ncbi:MAG: hypothetical protein AAFN77_01330 [Planctomycetota bacterium]
MLRFEFRVHNTGAPFTLFDSALMNSFSHALPYLDRPFFAAGCCVPDWLTACDRRCRTRKKSAALYVDSSDETMRDIALGVVQHHEDDNWFHRSAIFNNLNMQLAIEFRDRYGNDHSMRPSLIGHVIIEMFLDWHLESKFPGSVRRYYEIISTTDPIKIESAINQFATRPTQKLAPAIERFLDERYVFDYETDAGVRYRMNRVLQRIKLEPMPEASETWLAEVRQRVYRESDSLLADFKWETVHPTNE